MKKILAVVAATALAVAANVVLAADYPSRPVTLIVPWGAGGEEGVHHKVTKGTKPAVSSGLDFFNTGVTLVTDKAATGVDSVSSADGAKICWG